MIEVEIMQAVNLGRKNLTGMIEMAQIAAREMTTAVTVARLIQWTGIVREFGPFDVDLSLRGEKRSGPSIPGRKNTIEEIITTAHGKNQIFGPSDPHEIVRATLGQ
jgi:hypothetical protein